MPQLPTFLFLNLLALTGAISSTLKQTRDDLSHPPLTVATAQQELGPLLSKNTSLYFPNSPEFANITDRWSPNTNSDYAVAVIPATAQDVAATVKFADTFNIPLLAANQKHGVVAELSNVQHGISISVQRLNSITIADDGQTAIFGGGVYQDQIVNYLYEHGKVTATGACACVGQLGPGLGGGLGRYEGYYGLVLDNIVELDVVLANGSLVTASESSNPDLFWGLRGAGHNFGIVTSFRQKIYDIPYPDWFFATLIFTGDKLEPLFEALNAFGANGTQPIEATTYTLFVLNPAISATEPVIIFNLEYSGPASAATSILAPFFDIGPVVTTNQTASIPDSAHAGNAGLQDAVCQSGLSSWELYPVGLQVFNVSTNRAVYDLFKELLAEDPGLKNSIVQFEGYPQQGVRAVDPTSTAYAHRDDYLLVSFDIVWPPSQPHLEAFASKYGPPARELFHAGDAPGRPLNAYVNYASSDETTEALYGYEEWRLQKLRDLKKRYDPKGKFNYYHPII